MRRMTALAVAAAFALNAASPVLAAGQPQRTGVVEGTAQSPAGDTLPNFTVQLRNIQTGQLAGSTSSNAAGAFSFSGLDPASYVVEIVNQKGAIVGTSSAVAVSAGMTVSVSVTASAAAAIVKSTATAVPAAQGASKAGLSAALLITTVAAGAGVAGVVVAASKENASPSR
jgi:hypothetical protein